MDRAIEAWRVLHQIDKHALTPLTKKLCRSYTIYGCMLLLPQNALVGPEWMAINPRDDDEHGNNGNDDGNDDSNGEDDDKNENSSFLEDLYKLIAKELKITHIAVNKPIPPRYLPHHKLHPDNNPNDPNAEEAEGKDEKEDRKARKEEEKQEPNPQSNENILRAPINFTPVYGDFGPETCQLPRPSREDFARAFWVKAKQNGIWQVWAPRWTMFSRGNVAEKARLMGLESVRRAVVEAGEEKGEMGGMSGTGGGGGKGDDDGRGGGGGGGGFGVVDLYAGIGYFAFSYIQAGADRVYCWDLNPWSIEGLLRGAKANKWEAAVYGQTSPDDDRQDGKEAMEMMGRSKARLLVFNESNEMAPQRLEDLMAWRRPRIRHVNLGMLPSSRKALGLAAKFVCLRPKGWLHVHENFLVEEIERKAEETRKDFEEILMTTSGNFYVERLEQGQVVDVQIEHINRLKSYAPGVMHCVIDIAVEVRDR